MFNGKSFITNYGNVLEMNEVGTTVELFNTTELCTQMVKTVKFILHMLCYKSKKSWLWWQGEKMEDLALSQEWVTHTYNPSM